MFKFFVFLFPAAIGRNVSISLARYSISIQCFCTTDTVRSADIDAFLLSKGPNVTEAIPLHRAGFVCLLWWNIGFDLLPDIDGDLRPPQRCSCVAFDDFFDFTSGIRLADKLARLTAINSRIINGILHAPERMGGHRTATTTASQYLSEELLTWLKVVCAFLYLFLQRRLGRHQTAPV